MVSTPSRTPPSGAAFYRQTARAIELLKRQISQLEIQLAAVESGGSVALDDLTDVDTTGAGAGDVLTFDGSIWEPVAPGAPGAHAASHYAGGSDEVSIAVSQLDDGSACSVLGRSANSAGVYADITLANGEFLGRRSNVVDGYTLQASDIPSHNHATGDLTSGTLVAARFATGPGIITPAMLDNGAALSVLGVTGSSAAARADIASGGGYRFLGSNSGNTAVTFREITIYNVSQVLYEVDFSSLATNAFTNGTETIDGLNWTVANSAAAGATWGIVNGTGLRFSAATSTVTVFTSTTQSAAYLYLPLSSLPNWVQGLNIVIDLNFVADTFENGNDNCRFGLWGAAASPESGSAGRVSVGIKGNNGGTVTVGVGNGTTSTFSADAHDSSAVSARIESNGFVQSGYGTYSGGWPSLFTYAVCNNTASATGSNSLMDGAVRLVIAFPTASDPTPTTAVDIARMRVRTS